MWPGEFLMAQKHRFRNQRSKGPNRPPRAAPPPSAPRVVMEKRPPVVYGKAIVVLEDEAKSTFEFDKGAWVPYPMSIAECRRDCLVKELPQKVNRMTRYEIRCPVTTAD
jgi:hypothetical protein